MKMINRSMFWRGVGVLGGGLLVVIVGCVLVLTYKPAPFPIESAEVWAHRGNVYGGAAENSIGSVQHAMALGARGVELDVHFDLQTKKFLVAHDVIEGAEPLYLTEFFSRFGSSSRYWLDFKNLKDFGGTDAVVAAETLSALTRNLDEEMPVIVESIHASNLAPFAKKGIMTSYWVSLSPTESSLRFWYHIARIKWALLTHKITAISMPEAYFIPRVEKAFAGVPILLFTVNDPARIRDFKSKTDVRIILTDTSNY